MGVLEAQDGVVVGVVCPPPFRPWVWFVGLINSDPIGL